MGFGVDKIDRQSWLVKFRRAKCQDTLDTMRDAAIRNYEGNIGTVAKLAMRQPFVLFKGLTFQKLCLP
ncbi:molecular chaperone, partial (plasmid) [Escherichia coli]|uniref:hypothetical protein n=1 Tax=Escherichia coli TaxID=562 RepID=UPI0010AD525E